MMGVGGELAYDAINAMRLRYKKPPMSAAEYIVWITSNGLVKTGTLLETVRGQI